MKKMLSIKLTLILTWVVFIDAGEPTEWYVEFYSNDNEVHKVARDQYLEMKEFFLFNEQSIAEENKKIKWIEDYRKYKEWEFDKKFKEFRWN